MRWLLLLAASFVICAVVTGTAYDRYVSYREHIKDTQRAAQTLARTLEEHTVRTLQVADVVLRSARNALNAFVVSGAPEGERRVREFFEAQTTGADFAPPLLLLDRHGGAVGHSPARFEHLGLMMRSLFENPRAAAVDVPYISAPFRLPDTNTWAVALSYPRYGADRGFDGVIATVVDLAYFERFYASIPVGPRGNITLWDHTGAVILARYPHDEALIGVTFEGALSDAIHAGQHEGTLISVSPVDGVTRILGFRSTGALPMIISVGLSVDDHLAQWWADTYRYGAAAGVLALVILGLAAAIGRQLRLREARELDLEGNRRLLQTIVDQLPARISVKDRDLRYILVNRGQADEFGCAPEAALGKRRDDFHWDMPPPDESALFGELRDRDSRVLETGCPLLNVEESLTLRDGRARHSLSNKAPLFDGGGRVIGVLTIAVDITAQKLTEQKLREAREVAEIASRTKSEFLANMSHELRTPLNAVLGFSEVITDALMGPVDNRYREYARDIHNAGQHLLSLINDVLDLSKIEVGRLELNLEPVAIEPLIQGCCRVVAERAKRTDVALRVELAAGLPDVSADALRLRQVVLNLLSNAVKFTAPGGRVTVAAVVSATGGVTIAVEDTGIGMRPEDIAVALEPFRQVDSSMTRRYEGTGLGLPLAKTLTELHGGTLEIESALGVGTVARVHLPEERVIRQVA
jgi:two-component system cell cycle sensor histidine kinase PleC